jgi:hypothetical protein
MLSESIKPDNIRLFPPLVDTLQTPTHRFLAPLTKPPAKFVYAIDFQVNNFFGSQQLSTVISLRSLLRF